MPTGAAMLLSAVCGIWGTSWSWGAHEQQDSCLLLWRILLSRRGTGNIQAAFVPAAWEGKNSWVFLGLGGPKKTQLVPSARAWSASTKRIQPARLWDVFPNTSRVWAVGKTHISHIRGLCRGELPQTLPRKPSSGARGTAPFSRGHQTWLPTAGQVSRQ